MEQEFKQSSKIDRISIELTPEKEAKLVHWIQLKKTGISIDRNKFLERQKKYLFDFDDFVTFSRTGPWEGSANVHLPLTAIMVKTYHARLYNIFSQRDVVNLMPRDDMDQTKINIYKRLREWYLYDFLNGYKGVNGVLNEVIYDMATVGFGILMKSWDLKQRKAIVLEKVNAQELEKEMADLTPQFDEAVAGSNSLDVAAYKEVQKIITVFEGTKLQSVPFENIYFPNHIAETSDLNVPEMVLVTTEMRTSEIELGVKQGKWSQERADKVLQEGNADKTEPPRERNIKQIRDVLTGYDSLNSRYDTKDRHVDYAFCSYDLDDDGIAEEFVVTLSTKGNVLAISYLDRISISGRRPLFKFDMFTKARQAYSRGIPEFLLPLQEEMDMNHSMRMDYMQLQTCPFGVYRGGSSLDNQPIKIAPGKFIPVEEINDLKPFTFNTNASVFQVEEDRLWRYAEQLLSVSALEQGSVPSTVGPTRSTSGVVTLLQQMDKQLRPVVERFGLEWKKLEESLLEDLDYRVDPELKKRIIGPMLKENYSTSEIAASDQSYLYTETMDIVIDVASLVNSEEVVKNEATTILQTLIAPSVLQQSGIITPKGLYKATHDYLVAHGRDPDQFIDEPEFITKALTLWQEIQICAQGEVPPMAMSDNHDEKAVDLQKYLQSNEFQQALHKGIYTLQTTRYIAKAINKHMELAHHLKPQSLPNPSGNNNQNMNQIMAGAAPQQTSQGNPNANNRPNNPESGGNPPPVQSSPVAPPNPGGASPV